jgi:hypothetical protein
MEDIKYLTGDLFAQIPKDKKIVIPHVCNDIGGWGSGFVVPLAKHFPEARRRYLQWFQRKYDLESGVPFERGETQIIRVDLPFLPDGGEVYVANMIAQEGVVSPSNPRPIDYGALANCMDTVADRCMQVMDLGTPLEIHAPKFGSGLAGGDWSEIEIMIRENWMPGDDEGSIPVFIYSL